MKKVLIDTSILIDYLRVTNKNSSLYTEIIKRNDEFCISIITHTELYAGRSVWSNKKALSQLQELLSSLHIIPLATKTSVLAGQIRAKYNLDLEDSIIAATALDAKLPLATLNHKDFAEVKTLKLIK